MYPYPVPDDEYWDEIAGDRMNVSSGTDCTGLIPTAALSEYEYDSYSDMYDFLPDSVKDYHGDYPD